MNRREREIWEAAAAVGIGMQTSLAWVALGLLATPPPAPTPPIDPCPDCDDKGWRQMIHLSGAPDAETCPTCHNPHNHPCPWSLP